MHHVEMVLLIRIILLNGPVNGILLSVSIIYKTKEDMICADVKISCHPIQFAIFQFCGAYTKPHGVQGLIKHDHLLLYPKLVN